MNKATWKAINKLELVIQPVKQKVPKVFKREHVISHDFVLRPDYIRIQVDDVTRDEYRRVKDSCYWRLVGLRGYEFAILVRLSL